jgi:predicted PurR-regulated permease PerM
MITLITIIYVGAFLVGLMGFSVKWLLPKGLFRFVFVCFCILIGSIIAPIIFGVIITNKYNESIINTEDCIPASEIWQQWEKSKKEATTIEEKNDLVSKDTSVYTPTDKTVYNNSITDILRLMYDWIGTFHEGLVCVKLNNKYGFLDQNYKEIIPPKYEDASNFQKGLACVRLNNKYGFVDIR